MSHGSAPARWAAEQLARVSDDPAGRLALLSRTYREPNGQAGRHLPFRRAAISFMRWQLARGVLRPPSAEPRGSPWWRAINDRLLQDGCEAMAWFRAAEKYNLATAAEDAPSSATIRLWLAFIENPTGRNWYRAHNASIVSAYLEHHSLAERESTPERFFINVALMRVLYAHSLTGAPRLALGHLAPLGRILGDPRLGMAGAFLSLHHVLPDAYPLVDDLRQYLISENEIGRVLDYGVIGPRLQQLYEWSAAELEIPGLLQLIRDGSPIYAWPYEDRHVWRQVPESLPVRALRIATYGRHSAITL